jgi:hypothetical protein
MLLHVTYDPSISIPWVMRYLLCVPSAVLRVWEDLLASNFVTQTSRSDTSCFLIYLAMPIQTMYIHPCDVRVVQNIPILSYRAFREMQLKQAQDEKMLGEAA